MLQISGSDISEHCCQFPWKHVSLILSYLSCSPVLTVTMDKEMVPAPVIQVTHIIIPSSLQGDHRVQINRVVISATGLFLVLPMFFRMFSWVVAVPNIRIIPASRSFTWTNIFPWFIDGGPAVHSSPQGHRNWATFLWLLANWFSWASHREFREVFEHFYLEKVKYIYA